MPEKMYKTVLRPIEVAAGDFCWEYEPPFRICGHFDNEGGHSNCSIGLDSCERLRDSPDGIRKPAACAELKERAQSAKKGSER